jgi:cell division protein ZapA (FtsZ GTPase activity inhibitor)
MIDSIIALFRKVLAAVATVDDLLDLRQRLNEAESKALVLEERLSQLEKQLSK